MDDAAWDEQELDFASINFGECLGPEQAEEEDKVGLGALWKHPRLWRAAQGPGPLWKQRRGWSVAGACSAARGPS